MATPGTAVGFVRLLAALGAVVALGALSRLFPVGFGLYDKSLGDALYAAAAYFALSLLLYRLPPGAAAAPAAAVCLVVECFKLTGLPARWSNVAAVRWLLGTSFSWHNLACYAAGVALAAALDVRLLRRRPRAGGPAAPPYNAHVAPRTPHRSGPCTK